MKKKSSMRSLFFICCGTQQAWSIIHQCILRLSPCLGFLPIMKITEPSSQANTHSSSYLASLSSGKGGGGGGKKERQKKSVTKTRISQLLQSYTYRIYTGILGKKKDTQVITLISVYFLKCLLLCYTAVFLSIHCVDLQPALLQMKQTTILCKKG